MTQMKVDETKSLDAMSRKELQALSKKYGLKANIKSNLLRDSLSQVISNGQSSNSQESDEKQNPLVGEEHHAPSTETKEDAVYNTSVVEKEYEETKSTKGEDQVEITDTAQKVCVKSNVNENLGVKGCIGKKNEPLMEIENAVVSHETAVIEKQYEKTSSPNDKGPWQSDQSSNNSVLDFTAHLAFMQTEQATGIINGAADKSETLSVPTGPQSFYGVSDRIVEEGSEDESEDESQSSSVDGNTCTSDLLLQRPDASAQNFNPNRRKRLHVGIAEQSEHLQQIDEKTVTDSIANRSRKIADTSDRITKKCRTLYDMTSATAVTMEHRNGNITAKKQTTIRKKPSNIPTMSKKSKLSKDSSSTVLKCSDPLGNLSDSSSMVNAPVLQKNCTLKKKDRSSSSKSAFGRTTPEYGNKSRIPLKNLSNSGTITVKPFKANTSRQAKMELPKRGSKTMQVYLERQRRGREERARKSKPAEFHR